jgi:hypothetical protein
VRCRPCRPAGRCSSGGSNLSWDTTLASDRTPIPRHTAWCSNPSNTRA